MNKHLTTEQQARFETFFNAVLSKLGAAFEGKIDEFMIPPLRYSQSSIFPVDKAMTRNRIRYCLDYAIVRAGDTYAREGKGVYTVDRVFVNNFEIANPDGFIVEISCARRGGRVITFSIA